MATLVVDIDFTIANARPVVEELARRYGIEYDEWERYWRSLGIEEKHEILKEWYMLVSRKGMEPVEGSAEALKKMADHGYKIIYLTARDSLREHEDGVIDIKSLTEEWLRMNGFPDGTLLMNNNEKGLVFKSQTLTRMRIDKPAYGIGDTKEDMIAYISARIKPILFNSEIHSFYNKPELFFSPEIIHMDSWERLEDLIRENPFIERFVRFVINGEEMELPLKGRFSSLVEEAEKAFGKFETQDISIEEREEMPGMVREWIVIHGRKLQNN